MKTYQKVLNVFRKHKRLGLMTLLQCEKKPLRGEMFDAVMMISSLGPNVLMNFKRIKMTL